jgi:hypothetical protein
VGQGGWPPDIVCEISTGAVNDAWRARWRARWSQYGERGDDQCQWPNRTPFLPVPERNCQKLWQRKPPTDRRRGQGIPERGSRAHWRARNTGALDAVMRLAGCEVVEAEVRRVVTQPPRLAVASR